jgi:hypothetical protein
MRILLHQYPDRTAGAARAGHTFGEMRMGRQVPVRSQLVSLALTCAVIACTDLSHPSAGTPADPAAVTAAVQQRLCAERVQEICDLQVSMDSDGTVWLNGRTYTLAMADRARQIMDGGTLTAPLAARRRRHRNIPISE